MSTASATIPKVPADWPRPVYQSNEGYRVFTVPPPDYQVAFSMLAMQVAEAAAMARCGNLEGAGLVIEQAHKTAKLALCPFGYFQDESSSE